MWLLVKEDVAFQIEAKYVKIPLERTKRHSVLSTANQKLSEASALRVADGNESDVHVAMAFLVPYFGMSKSPPEGAALENLVKEFLAEVPPEAQRGWWFDFAHPPTDKEGDAHPGVLMVMKKI